MKSMAEGCLSINDWLEHLSHTHPRAIDMGLERIRAVYALLPSLHQDTKVVVVAGTNGKGSAVACLEAMAASVGLRVASYTSPHLCDFAERLRIDGRVFSEANWCSALADVEQARIRVDISLSYFEFTTLAALVLLVSARPDLAILEIGLGGALDAVNIIDGDVAVLTSIDLDHTEYLGSSLEAIAKEKAAIFRADKLAVVAEQNAKPLNVIKKYAALSGAVLHCLNEDFSINDNDDKTWAWHSTDEMDQEIVISDLPLSYLHPHSVACALQTWVLLYGAKPPAWPAVARVAAETRLAGRCDCRQYKGVATVLDVAHNPAAACYLTQCVATNIAWHCIFGMRADKDITSFVAALQHRVCRWYLVDVIDETRRQRTTATELLPLVINALDKSTETDTLATKDYADHIYCAGTVQIALNKAIAIIQSNTDTRQQGILVCGSFGVVAQALVIVNEECDTPAIADVSLLDLPNRNINGVACENTL